MGANKNDPVRQSKQAVEGPPTKVTQVNVMKEETRDMNEDDILDDKEVVMNQRVKGATRNEPTDNLESKVPESGSFSRLKSEDMRKEIEKMSKKLEEDQIIKENEKESSDAPLDGQSELGQPDSDSEEEKRL